MIDILRHRSLEQPDRLAYSFLSERDAALNVTYRELERRSRALAAKLQSLGFEKERALLLFPPGLDFVTGFLGCLCAGTVAVPAYPPHARRIRSRLVSMFRDSRPKVVVTTSEIRSKAPALAAQMPELGQVEWIAADELEDGLAEAWRPPALGGEDLAFLQYTSGSTSSPKGVMVSHGNLLQNERVIGEAFGQTEASVVVGWLPLYHDMGLIGNVLLPLYVGAPCILMSPVAFLQSPLRWLSAISSHRATTSGGPNFAYELCARKITDEQKAELDLSSWRVAFNGAEPVRPETLDRFAEAFASCGFRREAFYPCYGLAEATLFAAGGRLGRPPVVRAFAPAGLEQGRADGVAQGRALVGCGGAWLSHRIAIVDPETSRACPPGQVGEIWIAGPSVAQGYWDHPEATERDFHARLAEEPAAGPFLRTGDFGFFETDGELFVTGRLKDLIILRGRNHYPQDIEITAERAHAALRPGCGAAFPVDLDGEERLVVVQEVERHSGDAPAAAVAEAIRSAVSQEHEVQVHEVVLVRVGTIPKTSSGKIQRHACRVAWLAGELTVVGRSVVGEVLGDAAPALAASAWEGEDPTRAGLLALEPAERSAVLASWLRERAARHLRVAPEAVDQDRPLTALGLDSLAAVELEQEVGARLGVSLPLARLLDGVSLRELTEQILSALAASPGAPPAGPLPGTAADGGDLVPSHGQKALWFLQRMAPESAAWHITAAMRVAGALDTGALRRSFLALAGRHPALRTTFSSRSGAPVLRIRPEAAVDVLEEEAPGLGGSALAARLAHELHRPFDLEGGPPLRMVLLRLGPGEHALGLAVHHIVADFWSLAVLFEELGRIYAREIGGAAELPPVPEVTFVDWAAWQTERLAGAEGERLWEWWRETLGNGVPDLDLPTDRPRPAVRTDRGASVTLTLEPELTERLHTLAAEAGSTLFMTLLAGFQAVLHRWSGQRDLTVGCPVAGRNAPGVAGVIGYFVNPVVVRADLAGEPSFASFLGRVRRAVLGALAHGEYPFPLLTERLQPVRDPSRSPLFQAMFILQKAHRPEQRALAPFALGEEGASIPLGPLTLASLALPERPAQFDLTLMTAVGDAGIAASLQLNADLFDRATAARLLGHWRNLLAGATAAPGTALGVLQLLSEVERVQVLLEWNATAEPYPAERTLDQLIAGQAARTPDLPAVEGDGAGLTYAELASRAALLAGHLERMGVGPEVPVGIFTDRTPDMAVGLLGVLRSGGAYLPLDPAYPADRVSYMLADAEAPVVLTQERHRAALGGYGGRLVCLDSDWAAIERAAPLAASRARPEQLAYLIYTSGSTGRPKGVQVTQRGVVNFLSSMARSPGIGPGDVLVSVSTLSFDIAGLEIYLPLLHGARVVLAGRDTASDGAALWSLLISSGATMMQATPATWRLLLAAGWDGTPRLRVLCGGEALPRDLADELLARGSAVWNLYGPTEATIWSAVARVGPGLPGGPAVLSIGRPISNTSIHLVDRDLQPLPVGVPGELLIGGDGMARGYRGRPEMTAESFIPDPWSGVPGARLYRTGDLARFRPGGEIEFLGRLDHQVKIRGFRIELGEVEAALARQPGVRQCVVVARPDRSGLQRLVAYAIFRQGVVPDVGVLRRSLAAELPEAFVPSVFVALEQLPLTPNGKVDRKALPAPEARREEGTVASPPRSALERSIAGIWRELLQVERVGLHDNFFDLGGHSLLASQVHARLRESSGLEVSMMDLFRHPTVAALARFLAPSAPAGPAPLRGLERPAAGAAVSAIAIVGMAGRFPGAPTVQELWRRLRAGDEMITLLSDEELTAAGVDPSLLADPAYVRAAGVIEGAELFDAAFFGLSPRDAELMDPQHRVFLECAWHVLEDAAVDPGRFPGRIGLYAGVGINTYLHHAGVEQLQALAGRYQAFIANDKDFVPTRASYKLDLKGPSINVQTACSTSLVAVHLACQALRAGECELALAGGVSLRSPQKTGYLYEEGGIPSPDGHCRAFDAGAQGTVFGNGVGLVALKPLEHALADGDTIHAVIRGTALNNDGALKVGYTAPSLEGQARVIADALDAAGIDPATISYVEAHGTGTSMGDPIEVAALTQAFGRRTERRGFCALGSVKTNLGHLDTAAGVAGLIKTALALEHREIPPSLHFEKPNPRIDFAASPFFVNAGLHPWEAPGGAPRRAGVSSFGIGGTNAHVVLEEAPPVAPSSPSRHWQLLLVSARTPAALEAACGNLAAVLAERPELPLADVAHTLRVGRKPLAHRRALVCATREEAAAALEGREPERLLGGVYEGGARTVAFLFSGQGSQHAGMARGLYESEPVFRRALDESCELLRPHLGRELRELLFPAPGEEAVANRALEQTALAQPALFAVEHALARLWMSWGVRPSALLGHSIGEYVAGCLAGVFTLPAALALVAARGRLMQSLPSGAMLSVQLPEAEVVPLLAAELSLAAVNGPAACVASGPAGAVEALEWRLDGMGARHRRLHTSHAFHSAMMEPILDAFAAEVARAAPRTPDLPFVSNLTGTWITADEATDPGYWARHLRGTVRFADGLRTLLSDADRILLEVGPGNALATLARQSAAGRGVVASLPHPREERPDLPALLEAVGRLWLAGVEIDGAAFVAEERRRRVPLPLYPFEGKRFWLESQPRSAAAATDRLARKADLADWIWTPLWRQAVPPRVAVGDPAGDQTAAWLLLSDEEGPGARLAERLAGSLAARGRRAAVACVGTSFARQGDGRYIVDPARRDDLSALLGALREDGLLPDRIVHLLNVTEAGERAASEMLAGLPQARVRAFDSLLALAQALESERAAAGVRLAVLSDGLHRVAGEPVRPESALLLGPVAVIPQEIEGLTCRNLDVRLPPAGSPEEDDLIEDLLAEIGAWGDPAETVVAWRGGERWVRAFGPDRLDREEGPVPRVRDGGVYLITGGLGGLGLTFAGELAGRARVKLALIGRTQLPEGDDRHGRLRSLEETGAEVLTLAADVTDEDSMAAALATVEERLGPVSGVIHAAGLPGGRLLQLESGEGAEAVLAPKVRGTLVLQTLLAGRELDFFVLCSSINAVIGGFGQVGYAAANAFLDAFAAASCRRRGPFVVSVGWDRWEEVGMAARSSSPLALWQGDGAAPVHPLLDSRVEESAERQVWATEMTVERHWVLSEHRIVAHPTVPGTAYLEMARAAFAASVPGATGRPVELRDVVFLSPLVVLPGQRREVRTVLEGSGDARDFRVMSRLGGGAWQEHARGRVAASEAEAPSTVDLADLRSTFTSGEVTEWSRVGDFLVTGPRWQSLRRILLGAGESLAELALDEAFAGEMETFGLHPALLDVAAGAVQLLGDGDYLPLAYDRLVSHLPLTRRSFSHFRLRGEPGDLLTCDITLLDEAGRVLAEVEGFSMRRVGREAAEQLRQGIVAAPAGGQDAADRGARRPGGGVLPQQGARILRRILRDGARPCFVVSTRHLPAVIDEARSFGRDRLAERLEAPGAPAAVHARPEVATAYVPPTDDLEGLVAALWEKVLGIERVGIHDNFFELGGTSLGGIQLVAEIKKQLGVDVPTVSIFQAPTVSALAKYLRPAGHETSQFVASRSRAEKKKQALAQARRAVTRRRA